MPFDNVTQTFRYKLMKFIKHFNLLKDQKSPLMQVILYLISLQRINNTNFITLSVENTISFDKRHHGAKIVRSVWRPTMDSCKFSSQVSRSVFAVAKFSTFSIFINSVNMAWSLRDSIIIKVRQSLRASLKGINTLNCSAYCSILSNSYTCFRVSSGSCWQKFIFCCWGIVNC